ncbi:hypothetical protein FQN50_002564 [Emmonsiellopsis sp. PD_5]|nr:hypothetical protein FQN50_002564 [Emmonsiellopsis sp. PD_5]
MGEANGSSAQNGSAANGNEVVHLDPRIAISPNAPKEVPRLLEEVASYGKDFVQEDPKARMKLLESARALVYALETPREAMIRYCWSDAAAFASIETAIERGIFVELGKGDGPKKVVDIAAATNCDAVMLSRIMKHMAAVGVIAEAGPDEYKPTGISNAFTIKTYSDGFPCMCVLPPFAFLSITLQSFSGLTVPRTGSVTKATNALPEFLKSIDYKLPQDGRNCAFNVGYKTNLSFFEYLGANPKTGTEFNNHMGAYRQGRPSWMDHGFFPVEKQLIQGADTGDDAAFLVDVGGSLGHDLMEFHSKWSNAPGKLILQDQPHVIEEAKQKADEYIETMVHDFFTEQPVKGARAYYMHSILHDWPDEVGVKILEQLAAAMRPGYSKILINENVIPSTDAYWESTALDIVMMSLFSSQERTEKQWRKLIASAGLKIVNIWTVEKGVESLIECELP